jgi:hypothetical protein
MLMTPDIELLFIDVAMPHPHLVALSLKLADQILGGGYRPVPPAGAAKGDGEIGPSFLQIVIGILPTKRPQFLLEVRIGEAAEIEDEVGIGGETVPVSERNNRDRRFAAWSMVVEGADQESPEIMDGEVTCIENHVGLGLELGHSLPF